MAKLPIFCTKLANYILTKRITHLYILTRARASCFCLHHHTYLYFRATIYLVIYSICVKLYSSLNSAFWISVLNNLSSFFISPFFQLFMLSAFRNYILKIVSFSLSQLLNSLLCIGDAFFFYFCRLT